jgi:hypothetical protein
VLARIRAMALVFDPSTTSPVATRERNSKSLTWFAIDHVNIRLFRSAATSLAEPFLADSFG